MIRFGTVRIRPAALLFAVVCGLTAQSSALRTTLVSTGAGLGGAAVLPNSRLDFLYHRRYHGSGIAPVSGPADRARIGYVEFDDYGWYRDPGQARALLDTLQAMSAHRNVAVVVYAHGWRHNCSEGDADMKQFKATLDFLQSALEQPAFSGLRRQVSGDSSVTVVGIAVGWRGQAWPEMQRWLPYIGHVVDIPVYFSSIGRKQVAQVIGEGDLKSFLGDLANLYDARWPREHATEPAPLMSLVVVGHSFGGHAVWDATRERIEGNVKAAIVGRHAGRDSLGAYAVPAPGGPALGPCLRRVAGIGDLVVLINPAIEAASYRHVDELVHSVTRFRSDQAPVVLTISSRNDGARNTVFRGLRWVTNVGRASLGARQRTLEGQALGSYPAQWTNELDLVVKDGPHLARAREEVLPHGRPEPFTPAMTSARLGEPLDAAAFRGLAATDLADSLTLGNVRLVPGRHPVPQSPAIVVDTNSDLVNGHSGFFRREFITWLADYVLHVEAKRLAHNERIAGATPLTEGTE